MKGDIDKVVASIDGIVLDSVCTIVVVGDGGSDRRRTCDFNLEGISSISPVFAFGIDGMNSENSRLITDTTLLHSFFLNT